ncbi:DUF2141 domain-containing protein [Sphingomonas sp. BIUV-7]|uniref:DUF2141 domain-containing protein n=1 Tax=Sphingomonas natans TaxID=3063330 RepID=A0ABT8Y9Z5_9SPHN|nr:DUF2141 domain-containing protein [Sphingomonas sp. BIUV-7]MDO6415159.1 DUF2141 domain-containing protein [Sphingomonas sp. BIUV-7]
MPPAPILLAAATLAAAPAMLNGGAVEVTVENVRSDKGMVMVQLCDRQHFLGKCVLGAHAPARAGIVVVTFRNVPPGDYAAMAFHDVNANGALDRWLGIPKEDFGFSGMKGLPLRPPRFGDSVFTHGAPDQKLAVKLNNYFG